MIGCPPPTPVAYHLDLACDDVMSFSANCRFRSVFGRRLDLL